MVERFGTAVILRAGGLIAAMGLAAALLAPAAVWALGGFAAVGLGLSVIFPLLISAAARSGEAASGTAIAAVSTLGYLGFLAGPPLLGIVAQRASIGAALWIVVVLCLGIVMLAGSAGGEARRPDDGQQSVVR